MLVDKSTETLSPWWRISVILVLIFGFSILIWIAVRSYQDAPPIPDKVVSAKGDTVFSGSDILAGQQVFLKHGLMENGSIWGHGAYLGPDFSAEYLHTLTLDAGEMLARKDFQQGMKELSPIERETVNAEVRRLLKENRYSADTHNLVYTPE
ncbi:MAG: hypothetical protein PHI97_19865 [Desulfobulbus sp.]|nr:hypothetical protein [Desulfobulbus sp.]